MKLRVRGFSLLEILLGSVLFAAVVVYVGAMWGVHARSVGHARTRMMASFICSREIENCITLGFNGVMGVDGQSQAQSITSNFRGQSETVDYSWVVYVQDFDPGVPELVGKMRSVTVTVNFAENSQMGGKKSVTYQTILCDT